MLIFPGPWFPGPCFPRILSPFHPSPCHPRCRKPSKNADKMLFFLSLWVPGCSPKAPRPCKNVGILLLPRQKHCKNGGILLLLGPRGPQENETGLLEMRLRGLFFVFQQSKKTSQNTGFRAFSDALGGLFPPSSPPNSEVFGTVKMQV